MKFKSYEEVQKQLSENKYYYSINEYFDDGNAVLRDEKCVNKKLTDEELKEWFNDVAKKVRSENTEEERQTRRQVKTYVELGYCSIKYDEDLYEYYPDIESDWFGAICEEIEGNIYKKTEDEEEEE